MFILFRYDLIQHLVGKIGDIKAEDSPNKQSLLLRQIVRVHSDTMRFVALLVGDVVNLPNFFILPIFLDSVESLLKHIR